MSYDASFALKLKAEINYINVHPTSKMGEHLFKFMCDIYNHYRKILSFKINVPLFAVFKKIKVTKLHPRDRNQLFSYMDKI